jgi:hypothetical protein
MRQHRPAWDRSGTIEASQHLLISFEEGDAESFSIQTRHEHARVSSHNLQIAFFWETLSA